MAKREIITLPDPRLRKPSAAVERVDDEVRALIDDMFETMYDAPGVGLAAVQVGAPLRVVVMDVNYREADENGETGEKQPIAMVNPEIVWRSDEMHAHEEGCLSIPDHYAEIERPDRVVVRYLDTDGREREMECDDMLATVVQHEIDHTNGKLFIDHLSRLKRERVIKKFVKAAKSEAVA